MRANIVWIGGLTLAGIGVAGLAMASQWMPASDARAKASAAAMALLAIGVIMACLGSLLAPRRLYKAKPARKTLFGHGDSQRRMAGRNFGQRAAYGKLAQAEAQSSGAGSRKPEIKGQRALPKPSQI